MRNTTKWSSPQRGIEELALQPTVRVQNAEQTEAGAKQKKGQQSIPGSDPAVDESMIRRIMAALMAEE